MTPEQLLKLRSALDLNRMDLYTYLQLEKALKRAPSWLADTSFEFIKTTVAADESI